MIPFIFLCVALGWQAIGWSEIATADLKQEIAQFTKEEMTAHLEAIPGYDPPPESVLGALTTGDYSWGSFMHALAALQKKETARAIAEMGLIEARKGSKAFSQLYAALALRQFGTDLKQNAIWQSMNSREQAEWRSLLQLSRFYDKKLQQVIDLPENYLGVAARIGAVCYQMGIFKNRVLRDLLIERACQQFLEGAIYADDFPPTGRYDRYSNEFARFCWDAAAVAERADLLEKLKPTLKQQIQLWWDLINNKGYGYNWGRTQGLTGYLDTLEICTFVGQYAQFRPAPLADIASVYQAAWRSLAKEYDRKRHLFRIFEHGKGHYTYINPTREWQQTTQALGKLILTSSAFIKVLEKEKVKCVQEEPHFNPVARFQFFNKTKNKQSGVWIIRQGKLAFTLPITTGPQPGIADYLPAPFGLSALAMPVEEIYPALVPFLTLADKETYVASEGANRIQPSADGNSLTVAWCNWGKIGSLRGETFRTGLTSVVKFAIRDNQIIRHETLTADKKMTVKRWKVAFPLTLKADINIQVKADWQVEKSLFKPGKGRLGKSPLGPLPQHVIYEARDISFQKGESRSWECVLEVQ